MSVGSSVGVGSGEPVGRHILTPSALMRHVGVGSGSSVVSGGVGVGSGSVGVSVGSVGFGSSVGVVTGGSPVKQLFPMILPSISLSMSQVGVGVGDGESGGVVIVVGSSETVGSGVGVGVGSAGGSDEVGQRPPTKGKSQIGFSGVSVGVFVGVFGGHNPPTKGRSHNGLSSVGVGVSVGVLDGVSVGVAEGVSVALPVGVSDGETVGGSVSVGQSPPTKGKSHSGLLLGGSEGVAVGVSVVFAGVSVGVTVGVSVVFARGGSVGVDEGQSPPTNGKLHNGLLFVSVGSAGGPLGSSAVEFAGGVGSGGQRPPTKGRLHRGPRGGGVGSDGSSFPSWLSPEGGDGTGVGSSVGEVVLVGGGCSTGVFCGG